MKPNKTRYFREPADPYYKPLKQAMIAYFKATNTNQRIIAERLGVSQITLSAIMNGKVKFPQISILYDIHALTGISFYYDRKLDKLLYNIPESLKDITHLVEERYTNKPIILTDTNTVSAKSD